MMRINNHKGFTLVEMLIAISIFAVVATLASSLFSTFANNQKRTKVSQELLNNAQYVLEIISREVKNNEIIAFGSSLDIASRCKGLQILHSEYTQCLLFVRENGETAAFLYSGSQLSYAQLDCTEEANGVYTDCDIANGQQPAIMLSADYNNVDVSNLEFFLSPDINPYFDDSVNQQPRVTIKMAVKYSSTKIVEQVTHYLQTTVSSRVYKR
jgi:prepilin-type N-terminal cleavage/methylation domain-containing protein